MDSVDDLPQLSRPASHALFQRVMLRQVVQ
jgi:hypothetical protein